MAGLRRSVGLIAALLLATTGGFLAGSSLVGIALLGVGLLAAGWQAWLLLRAREERYDLSQLYAEDPMPEGGGEEGPRDRSGYCPVCGAFIESPYKPCPRCGSAV